MTGQQVQYVCELGRHDIGWLAVYAIVCIICGVIAGRLSK